MNEEFRPLLPDEHSMLVYAPLAKAIGLNESIFVCQLHYWIENKRISGAEKIEGRYWVYNTFEEWQKQFCFMSLRTLKTVVKKLKDSGIVLTGNFNSKKFDRTTWYTLDYQRLNEIYKAEKESPIVQILHDENADIAPPIPYTTSYTTSNNSNKINGVSSDTQRTIYRPKDDVNFQVESSNTLSTEKDTFKDSTSFSPYCDNNDSTNVGTLDISSPSGMTTNLYYNIERAKIACDQLELTESQRTEILRIVKFFFETYRKYRGEEHPVLSQNLMDRVVMSIHDDDIPADSEIYTDIIENYFRNGSLKCDFHIQHFVSGDVRKFRSYECYGNMLAIYDT